jgi:hypothetical protein
MTIVYANRKKIHMTEDERKIQERKISLMKIAMFFGIIIGVYIATRLDQILTAIKALQK